VPWRFSDTGKRNAQLQRSDTASEKPAQKTTFVHFLHRMDFATALR